MNTSKLEVGQSESTEVKITTDLTTNRTGNKGDDVLSTPSMLGLMEGACIHLTDSLLDDDVSTVGYAVDGLRHIGRTDLGETVQIKTALTEIDREKGRLTYEIEVSSDGRPIGKALHKRAIISRG